jgi:hypothetical protein
MGVDESLNADAIRTSAEALEASILPHAHAVHCGPQKAPTAEMQPLPPAVAATPPGEKCAAQWAYERLILYIKNFEDQLDAEQEVAMGFTGSEAGTLRIEGIGYFAPDIVTFYGRDENDNRTQLIQHVTQMNVILRAMPKEIPDAAPRRIGFELARDLDRETERG